MKTKGMILISILFSAVFSYAQHTVDDYVRIGLENNSALKQKQRNYQKSLFKLKEAVSYYYPSVSIQARYSIAEGGRVIDFPVGDLLNPVYSTLNQLTLSESFPQIENEEINFLRSKEHETKIRATQPIFHPEIWYNSKIRSKQSELEFISVDMYKRELVAEIKKACYNYLKTLELKEVLNKTEEVLNEHIRVNRKLYENDQVTIDAVYRSRSELSKLDAQKAEVLKAERSAAAWINFLLNRALDEPIEIYADTSGIVFPTDLEESKQNALNTREELKSLRIYSALAEDNIQLNKSSGLPTVTAVIDYGFQGSEYEFTHENDYVLASIVLSWDIFKGFGNRHKIKTAQIEKERVNLKTEEAKQNIQLQVISAYYALEAASEEIRSSKEDVKYTRQVFSVINKKYKEGQANLLEYTDARNNMTNAELNAVIVQYEYMISYAEFEKAAAFYELNTY